MPENTSGKEDSLAKVCIVAIVALTICFLATQGFNFNGIFGKEKIEVTAYNSNLSKNSIDM